MAGQDAATDLHVQPAPVQRVVGGAVGKSRRALPKLLQLAGQASMHVVTEHLAQAVEKGLLVRGAEQVQRALVDANHPERGTALLQCLRMGRKMRLQIGHALCSPLVEQALERAVVLQP